MTFKAIFYDLDGTLVDSMSDIADCMNRVLERSGYPTHPEDDYRWFIGDGLDVLVQRALPEAARTSEAIPMLLDEIRAEYAAHWHDKTVPFAGIPELLVYCRERGLIQTVLTNKPHAPAVVMLDFFSLSSFFKIIQGAQPDLPRKPDPTMAIAMADRCGVAPEECLFLGDMPVDMETATGAGMMPVGALWGMRSAQDLADAGARALFRSPNDLKVWL